MWKFDLFAGAEAQTCAVGAVSARRGLAKQPALWLVRGMRQRGLRTAADAVQGMWKAGEEK